MLCYNLRLKYLSQSLRYDEAVCKEVITNMLRTVNLIKSRFMRTKPIVANIGAPKHVISNTYGAKLMSTEENERTMPNNSEVHSISPKFDIFSIYRSFLA